MRKTLLMLCGVILNTLQLHAHDVYDINISHIISQKGLSQNTVRTVAVDGRGFVWACTLDVLNR